MPGIALAQGRNSPTGLTCAGEGYWLLQTCVGPASELVGGGGWVRRQTRLDFQPEHAGLDQTF